MNPYSKLSAAPPHFFKSPLFWGSHLALLGVLLLWFAPLTHNLCQKIDVQVFYTLNGSLTDPFWQWFWGILNHRRETKLNLVVALLLNIWAILATPDPGLRKLRFKKTIYFWICFQIGFMLQEGLFNNLLHIHRDSPSLVLHPYLKLSAILQNSDLKEGTRHSFPSGHAFSLLYWASFTLLCAPRHIGILGLILAIFFCLPRLFIGAHWLSDEIFSAILALIWLSWTRQALGNNFKNIPRKS